jgi:hypothetical protein
MLLSWYHQLSVKSLESRPFAWLVWLLVDEFSFGVGFELERFLDGGVFLVI